MIAYIHALAVVGRAAIAGVVQVAGRVLQPQGPGLGQATAWVGIAPQQRVGGFPHALARQVHAQHRRNIPRPRALHRCAGVQHDHGVFLHGGNARDQVVLAFRQAQGAAVSVGADKALGLTRKHYGHVGVLGSRDRAQKLVLAALVHVSREALYIAHAAAFQQRGIQRTQNGGAGRALAPVARGLGKGTDVGHLLPGFQRQCAQILHQHAALRRQLHSQRMVGLGGSVRPRGGGGSGQQGCCSFGQRDAVQGAAAAPQRLRPGQRGGFKRRQVDLLQRALVHAAVQRGVVGGLVAAKERPHGGLSPHALHARNGPGGQGPGQVRILAEQGKAAAIQWAALDVGIHVHAVGLLPLRRARAARQSGVKAGRHSTSCGQDHAGIFHNGWGRHRQKAPFL